MLKPNVKVTLRLIKMYSHTKLGVERLYSAGDMLLTMDYLTNGCSIVSI